MAAVERPYRLSFFLRNMPPAGSVPLHSGCTVTVPIECMVLVGAPSRQAAFDQAAAIIRAAQDPKDGPPHVLAAVLYSPHPSGSDGWSIIVGADVAFSPTSLMPYFPALDLGPAPRPPPLSLPPA